jgi:hypothetical protein
VLVGVDLMTRQERGVLWGMQFMVTQLPRKPEIDFVTPIRASQFPHLGHHMVASPAGDSFILCMTCEVSGAINLAVPCFSWIGYPLMPASGRVARTSRSMP